jgi:hypothetical protein
MSELEELKEQVRELNAKMDALTRAEAEQQSMTLQMIAHVDVLNSAMRKILSGVTRADGPTLYQLQLDTFDKKLRLLSEKLAQWHKISASGVPLYLPPDQTDDLKQN